MRAVRWFWAVLLTLALHGVFALLISVSGYSVFGKVEAPRRTTVDPVALRAMDPSVWAANRSIGPRPRQGNPLPAVPPAPRVEKKPQPEPIPRGRVVDVAPGNGQTPPESDFLAETNNRVEKQSRSRHATPFYGNAAPRPTTTSASETRKAGSDPVDQEEVSGNEGRGEDEAPPRHGSRKGLFEVPNTPGRDRLALRFEGLNGEVSNREASDELRGNSDRLRIQAGGEQGEEGQASAGRSGSRELRTLSPSVAVLDRILGAPANDLTPMDDVPEGEGTFLNTREWKYSSFFNRVKQNVGMHWNPNTVVRSRDPTGEVFLYKDRYTVLSVSLDSQGLLKEVAVDRSSGVDFLDGEAMAAFRRAQPFPNPPPGLRNERGEVRFTFGFFLEVNRAGLRLFRPAN